MLPTTRPSTVQFWSGWAWTKRKITYLPFITKCRGIFTRKPLIVLFLKRPASKKLCVHKNTLRTTKKGAHAIINSFGSKKPPKFDIFKIYNRNINDFLGLENRRNRGCRKYSLFSHWRMLRAFKKFLLSLYFAFITLRVFVECWQKSCTVNLISLISVIFLKILVVI